MQTETYKGRKLKVRIGRKGEWGKAFVTVNGESWTLSGVAYTEEKALDYLRSVIDGVGDDVDGDRYAAHWYAPGSYVLCDEGLHPVALGGECRHSTCVRKRAAKEG